MTLHVPQIQKTQAKTPGPPRLRQADEQIGNLPVFDVELRLVAVAGLAHTKRTAGQRDADALVRHRSYGHLPTLGWPGYFFPKASFRSSFCMLSSAYIFFKRRFSSSMPFISEIIGSIHAAVLRPPFVKRRVADRVLAAKIGDRQPALRLAQNSHDLRFRKSALSHPNLLVQLVFLGPRKF